MANCTHVSAMGWGGISLYFRGSIKNSQPNFSSILISRNFIIIGTIWLYFTKCIMVAVSAVGTMIATCLKFLHSNFGSIFEVLFENPIIIIIHPFVFWKIPRVMGDIFIQSIRVVWLLPPVRSLRCSIVLLHDFLPRYIDVVPVFYHQTFS